MCEFSFMSIMCSQVHVDYLKRSEALAVLQEMVPGADMAAAERHLDQPIALKQLLMVRQQRDVFRGLGAN